MEPGWVCKHFMDRNYQIIFGDIHNHNALGYGVGSLERSIDVARTHLDFFYLSNQHTLATIFGRTLDSHKALATRREHIVDVVSGYLRRESHV